MDCVKIAASSTNRHRKTERIISFILTPYLHKAVNTFAQWHPLYFFTSIFRLQYFLTPLSPKYSISQDFGDVLDLSIATRLLRVFELLYPQSSTTAGGASASFGVSFGEANRATSSALLGADATHFDLNLYMRVTSHVLATGVCYS